MTNIAHGRAGISLPGRKIGSRSKASDGTLLTRSVDLLFGWLEMARSRRQLRELDDRMLKDIGVNRYDAEREAAKPFWRD